MLAARGGNLRSWQEVPWYALSAGVLGLVIVTAIGYTVPRLGLSKAFTIIVASQFLTIALLYHFGVLGAVLRPLDLMQPYRLEMGTKFANPRGKDLYQFWGDRITEDLNKQLQQFAIKNPNLSEYEACTQVLSTMLNDSIGSLVETWLGS